MDKETMQKMDTEGLLEEWGRAIKFSPQPAEELVDWSKLATDFAAVVHERAQEDELSFDEMTKIIDLQYRSWVKEFNRTH